MKKLVESGQFDAAILTGLSEGATYKEISKYTGLKMYLIGYSVKLMSIKYDAKNRTQLALKCKRLGIY